MKENKQDIAKKIDVSDLGKERMTLVYPNVPVTGYLNEFGEDTYDYIDWHWHDEAQFCLVLDGSVIFRVVDREYRIEKGGGIFIPSRYVHMARPDGRANAGYYCLDIESHQLLHRLGQEQLNLFGDMQDSRELLLIPVKDEKILRSIAWIQEHTVSVQEDDLLLLYSELLRLLHWTRERLLHAETDASLWHQNERLFRILLFLQNHYMERISLNQVADQIHLSTSECCRFFKQMLGQTIFDYLKQYRIDRSKEMLQKTSLSVAEIAYASGFSSQSYYTMVFRKETGYTPTDYRTHLQEKGYM